MGRLGAGTLHACGADAPTRSLIANSKHKRDSDDEDEPEDSKAEVRALMAC